MPVQACPMLQLLSSNTPFPQCLGNRPVFYAQRQGIPIMKFFTARKTQYDSRDQKRNLHRQVPTIDRVSCFRFIMSYFHHPSRFPKYKQLLLWIIYSGFLKINNGKSARCPAH